MSRSTSCICGSGSRPLFGLLNSTPHSGRLPDPQMHDVLRDMAHGALGLT